MTYEGFDDHLLQIVHAEKSPPIPLKGAPKSLRSSDGGTGVYGIQGRLTQGE
jgi:hypothetical protein